MTNPTTPQPTDGAVARQLQRFVPNGDCWEWSGSKNSRGYGTLAVSGKTWLAHRLSYLTFNGKIPDGIQVCHECDNRSCINPKHLFLGTARENAQDMLAKGRGLTGARNPHSRLSAETVMAILKYPAGMKKTGLQFGVSKTTVYDIRSGRGWGHLTGITYAKQ